MIVLQDIIFSKSQRITKIILVATCRSKQLLLQVFSHDTVLQLVPSSAIPLLLEYSDGGPPDQQLGSLIPALGMIFINTRTIGNDKELVDVPKLRQLSGTLAH